MQIFNILSLDLLYLYNVITAYQDTSFMSIVSVDYMDIYTNMYMMSIRVHGKNVYSTLAGRIEKGNSPHKRCTCVWNCEAEVSYYE